MKKSFLLLLLFAANTFVGQNAYYDALKLKQYIISNKFIIPHNGDSDAIKLQIEEYTAIINKYYNNKFTSVKELHDKIGTYTPDGSNKDYNPFLSTYLSPAGVQTLAQPQPVGKGLFTSIGSTPVTNIADGLAKFLVKRAKQELLVSFFQKFPELQKKYPEMTIIFPNTCELVNNFNSWEYANIINTLKEALEKDLQGILTNLPKIASIDTTSIDSCKCGEKALKRIKKYQTFLTTDKGIAISGSLLIAGQFISGNKLPDIINNVGAPANLAKIDLTDNTKEQNIKTTLAFIRIISNALRSNDVTKSYVTNDEIKDLLTDPVTRDLFLGLLYQQMVNENVVLNGQPVTAFLKPANIVGTKTYIQNFVAQSQSVSDAIKKLKTDKAAAVTDLDDDWAAIFQAVNDFIPVVANVDIIDSRIKLPEGIQNIVEKSQFATAVAHDIAIRNYSAAIVTLLNQMVDKSNNEDFSEFKSFFVKYGSFAANVAQAKNSDEVEEAIESVALPVGSASIKKKTCFSIALNAYLGGFYGNEYLATKEIGSRWAPISGVYAPVGVTFSKGLNFGKLNYGSLSLLINAIDIGAVAAYRLEDEETEKLPEITLQNILAPGIGIVYGLPDFPLSVGWSYQFGPALRKINATEADSEQANRRWQFFLAVDIPIFNLYSSSKAD